LKFCVKENKKVLIGLYFNVTIKQIAVLILPSIVTSENVGIQFKSFPDNTK
jgi:hypothetical protein